MSQTDRRDFLNVSAATVAGGALLSNLVHAAGPDTIKVGLIGCGGRGTGAATQALRADDNVKLTAVGDMWPDKLNTALKNLQREGDLGEKRGLTSATHAFLLGAAKPRMRALHLDLCFDPCEQFAGIDRLAHEVVGPATQCRDHVVARIVARENHHRKMGPVISRADRA